MTKPYSLDLRDRAQLREWWQGGNQVPLGCGDVAGGRFERREMVLQRFRATGSAAPRKMGAIGRAF